MILLLHQASGEYTSLLDIVAPYTGAYAEKHEMAYLAMYGRLSDRHPYWDKFAAIIDALSSGRYQGVIYMDADTVIARPEEPIPLHVGGSGLGMCWHPVDTEPHWNVGVIHATPAALPILQEAWGRHPVHHAWPEQMALNWTAWEQNADVYCLDHAYNQNYWYGAERTWIQAWHGGGSCGSRREAMIRYMQDHRLYDRLHQWPTPL